ncbi:MAG: hypothetical protein QM817_12605 [Archangium sp.]
MTRKERLLFHQLHPLKLLTDFTTSFASAWLLWEARWWEALAVAFLPSFVVTGLLVTFAELDGLQRSPMGRYVSAHMTRAATSVRIAGQIVMWLGAIAHVSWLLPLGLMIVIFGWLRGLWAPAATAH